MLRFLKNIACCWLLAAIPAITQAQQKISGKVTGSSDNQPVAGASVTIKGTNRGTRTDNNGVFTIDAANGTTIVISAVGYTTIERVVGTDDFSNIELQVAESDLNEVVVVGYGTKKKASLTGALSVLDMKERENRPITNASQALHGVAGLWVNQAGGKPGQGVAAIKIRGIGTLNNSNPLVLVDGIEYNMNEINPATIESITVLKDAAAAIYGSRAANGVILVTTKGGQKGRMKVDYSFSHGIQQVTYLPDVVWDPIQYMQMKVQALKNEGKTAVDYSEAQIEEYRNGMLTDPYTYPNINWFDLVTKNGYLQQHNLRFSGGTDKITFSMALGFMDQDGILIANNHARRYQMDLNLTAQVSNRLKVGGSIKGNYREYTENAHGTSYFFNRFHRVLPIFTPYLADGRYGNVVFPTPGRNAVENLMMLLKEGSNYHVAQRALLTVFGEYKLPFNITYHAKLGVDKIDGVARQFVPYLTTYNPKTEVPYYYNNNPYSYNYDNNDLNISFYHTLNWQKDLGLHNLSAMVGSSYTDFDNSQFDARIYGYFDNTLTDLNAGSRDMAVTGSRTEDVLISYFSRLGYEYDGKYLLDVTFRYDGSARFARGHQWGFFPAVSAGWRIDKEGFFANVKNVDLLKLRASWGKMGNQAVPLYSYLNAVNLGLDYSFNNVISAGAAVTDYSDPLISWETTTSYNAGVDAELWNGKLGASVDVFKRRTTDILRPVQIPSQVGDLNGPDRNVGTVDNTGFELVLSHRNRIGELTYEFSGQVTYVKNKVVDLNGERIISSRRITQEGYPIDSYYLLEAIGIYQDQDEIDNSATVSNNVRPGYLRYKDQNKDGKINGDDRIITGSSIPDFMFGFSLNFGYKGISLNTFWQGVQGVDIYPTANLAFPFNNGAGVTKEWITDSWTPERRNAPLPILTTATGATENFQQSTFWLQDASYLRLKNIQLKYDLPTKWVEKFAKSMSVFVNGANLFTISKFKKFDPEKDIKNDNLYEYPSLKTYSFGLNVNF